ncbi:pyrroline-5-carboxylate reductase [Altererythrobacter atlanticus]|uniref:Pyrroline-5-carboxylate reductase n=1 Tax=Croceibacterium atlanticum TaxID=1267766 RepID=A0A0F7KTC0_9SPHN|nr:pyrroline-5-carboxylate reductase [Croceibacterium atlanticum]AKH42376.1 Pyrroline-5-carboxylate reductase [Croceibacterium atlanticum]MBB5731153.1 pyrroline-5-carboxylate reductase [Croceibacterium atlanticum]
MAYDKILLVGCGNMAGAMLDGWLAAGSPPSRFTIADPGLREPREGVETLTQIPESGDYDAILIGVKPQMLGDIAPSVTPLVGQGTVILSILAGVEVDVLQSHFPTAGGVVRVMPNLAVALGKSPLALAAGGLDDAGKDGILDLFRPLGTPEWIDESEFDLVTGLAGSGPAFVYRFIDSLAVGAADLGLEKDKALRLALAMVEGASALASQSPHNPGELARRVASPGGTTQAGLDVLDDGDAMRKLMEACLRAARDRSAEMAQEARSKG